MQLSSLRNTRRIGVQRIIRLSTAGRNRYCAICFITNDLKIGAMCYAYCPVHYALQPVVFT